MALTADDIHFQRSALWPDLRTSPAAATNGGRMSATQIVDNSKNNLFPDVTASQRASGLDQYRKIFIKTHANGYDLVDVRLGLEAPTPGDSVALLYAGTQTDTQDAVSGRPYGYAELVSVADTVVTCTTEADWSGLSASVRPFQDGDLVRLDTRDDVTEDGVFEFVTVSTAAYDGTTLTLTLSAAPAGAYSAGNHVSACVVPDDIIAGYADLTPSAALTYDGTALTVPNVGAIYQEWTVTVTDHTNGSLRLDGDTLGSGVATGAMGAALAPINPATGTPYFSLGASGWGGTAATGDTLTFTTVPAAAPLWVRRIVPAGSAAISSDPIRIAVYGEIA